jgi:hypothetical protein
MVSSNGNRVMAYPVGRVINWERSPSAGTTGVTPGFPDMLY